MQIIKINIFKNLQICYASISLMGMPDKFSWDFEYNVLSLLNKYIWLFLLSENIFWIFYVYWNISAFF